YSLSSTPLNTHPEFPRVRAFLGALLETIYADMHLGQLTQSLNSLTSYDLGITSDMLSTAEKWNIK
ncbi:hypothetical protein MHK_007129, partial [Candidatus Magnetomorum sp. HK-1]